MRKLIPLLFTTLSLSYFSQKNQVAFSGELLYNIEKLSPADSLPAKMLLYAKDSLLKVINFSSTIGKQEMIKHLRLNRSYVLVSTTKGDFAIKTDHNTISDSLQEYTFKKKFGRKKIAGMKAKKALVKINGIDEKFIFYYTPKINARYSSSYQNLPGLALEYYVVNNNGLYKYTLENIKVSDPPIDIFIIPSAYKKVNLDEFIKQVSAQ